MHVKHCGGKPKPESKAPSKQRAEDDSDGAVADSVAAGAEGAVGATSAAAGDGTSAVGAASAAAGAASAAAAGSAASAAIDTGDAKRVRLHGCADGRFQNRGAEVRRRYTNMFKLTVLDHLRRLRDEGVTAPQRTNAESYRITETEVSK